MRARFSLLCLLLLSAACMKSSSTADSTKVADTTAKASNDDQSKSDIDKIRSGWKDAANAKDSAALANYYTDDAVMAVSEAPLAEGKGALEATFGRMVQVTKVNSIDSKQLVVHGDDAYDYGTYSQTVTMPNKKTVEQNGHYIVTLHKGSRGVWKINHHVATESQPAPH